MANASGAAFTSHLRSCLEPVLGPHTTGHAIKLACEQTGLAQESLTWDHADSIADALTPLLRTLLGRKSTDALTQKIRGKEGSS